MRKYICFLVFVLMMISLIACSETNNTNPEITPKTSAIVDFTPKPTAKPGQLNKPALSLSGTTVSWSAISNATGYVIKVDDGEWSIAQTELSYTLSATEIGNYTVYLKAVSTNALYTESMEACQVIEFTYEYLMMKALPGSGVEGLFLFEEDILNNNGGTAAVTQGNTSASLSYSDGYLTDSWALDLIAGNQYLASNFDVETGNFTIGAWVKYNDAITSDPPIFGNKNWKKGYNPGVVFVVRKSDYLLSIGGTNALDRFDVSIPYTSDGTAPYNQGISPVDGWVHVMLSIYKATGEIKIYINFQQPTVYYFYGYGALETLYGKGVLMNIIPLLPATGTALTFETNYTLNIGQDGTRTYSSAQPFLIDDLILSSIAFGDSEAAALKAFYGYEGEIAVVNGQLASPVLAVSGTTVSWNAVRNATGYMVKVNDGEWSAAQTELTYTLNAAVIGNYTIYVKAVSTSTLFTESVEANQIIIIS